MDRKTFIRKTAGALLLAVPAYALLSCSSSSDDSGSYNPPSDGGNPDPDCLENGATASNITRNHGHSLTVSSADVNAGAEKTYDIKGSGNHPHSVTVSAGDFTDLKNNQQIFVNSTSGGGDGHAHFVTISCA